MQLLCLVAMEPMVSFEANEIRNRKLDVLHAITPITLDRVHDCVVAWSVFEGLDWWRTVCGYREEPDISPHIANGNVCLP